LQGQYKYLDKIYPENLLDTFFATLTICPDDYLLMDKIYAQLPQPTEEVNEDLIREVLLVCVMGNDNNDVLFIKENPHLCEKCGWCCKNCDPIIVTQKEVLRMGSTKNFRLLVTDGEKDMYAIKLPCNYLLKDNTCSIYKKRPDSCKIFPIGSKNGMLTVQRTVHCGFIASLLVTKTRFFVELAFSKISPA
jgi:Fe-S-cluster containining protein